MSATKLPVEVYQFMVQSAGAALRGARRTEDDAVELANETYVRVGPAEIVGAAHGARDDIEFRGWLRKAIRRTLQQQQRDTPGGRVLLSLANAMREAADRFIRTGRRWCLQGRDHTYAPVDPTELRRVAAAVPVSRVSQRGTEERAAPIATRGDQRALCEAVLEAAGGCLDQSYLGKVVADRLGVAFDPRHELADPDDAALSMEDVGIDRFVDRDTVDTILSHLDTDELRTLRAFTVDGLGIRGAMEALGLKKHRVEKLRERLIAKMRDLAAMFGDVDIDIVIGRLEETSGHDAVEERLEPTHE